MIVANAGNPSGSPHRVSCRAGPSDGDIFCCHNKGGLGVEAGDVPMNVLTRNTFTLIMLIKLFRAIVICRHALPGMGADDLRDFYPFGRRLIGARIGGFVDGSSGMTSQSSFRICVMPPEPGSSTLGH